METKAFSMKTKAFFIETKAFFMETKAFFMETKVETKAFFMETKAFFMILWNKRNKKLSLKGIFSSFLRAVSRAFFIRP